MKNLPTLTGKKGENRLIVRRGPAVKNWCKKAKAQLFLVFLLVPVFAGQSHLCLVALVGLTVGLAICKAELTKEKVAATWWSFFDRTYEAALEDATLLKLIFTCFLFLDSFFRRLDSITPVDGPLLTSLCILDYFGSFLSCIPHHCPLQIPVMPHFCLPAPF